MRSGSGPCRRGVLGHYLLSLNQDCSDQSRGSAWAFQMTQKSSSDCTRSGLQGAFEPGGGAQQGGAGLVLVELVGGRGQADRGDRDAVAQERRRHANLAEN